jgi:transporter family protein
MADLGDFVGGVRGADRDLRQDPVDKMSVAPVAIFGVMFLGERITIANWTGIVFIAVGAVLVAYKF